MVYKAALGLAKNWSAIEKVSRAVKGSLIMLQKID
jgi:hypothetical protein